MALNVGELIATLKLENASFVKGIKESTDGIDSLTKMVTRAVAAVGGLAAVKHAFDMGKEATSVNAARQAFTALGGDIERMRAATKGMVADAELFKKANLAETMGITNKQFEVLAGVAQAAAAKTGQSMQFMLESVVVGTARQSKMILDNLGLMINIEQANEDYAASLGKNVKALTDAEQKQAFTNEVMKQGTAVMRQLRDAGVSVVNPLEQMTAAASNASDSLGRVFSDVFGKGLPAFKDLIATIERMTNMLEGADWTDKFHGLNAAIKTAADLALRAAQGITLLWIGVLKLAQGAAAMGGNVGKVKELQQSIDDYSKSIETLVGLQRALQGENDKPRKKIAIDVPGIITSRGSGATATPLGDGAAWTTTDALSALSAVTYGAAAALGLLMQTSEDAGILVSKEGQGLMDRAAWQRGVGSAPFDVSGTLSPEEIKKRRIAQREREARGSRGGQEGAEGAWSALTAATSGDTTGMATGALAAMGMGGAAGVVTVALNVMKGAIETWLTSFRNFDAAIRDFGDKTLGVFSRALMSGDNSKMGGAMGTAQAAAAAAMAPATAMIPALIMSHMTAWLIPLGLGFGALTASVAGVAMLFGSLSMETNSFKGIQAILGKTTQLVVQALEPAWRSFLPLAYLVYQTTAAMLPLMSAFVQTTAIGHALFDGLKVVSLVTLTVATGFMTLHATMLDFGSTMLNFASKAADMAGDTQLRDRLWEEAAQMGGDAAKAKENVNAMDEQRRAIEALTYSGAIPAAEALIALTDATQETTRNLPSGYAALKRRRIEAMDDAGGGAYSTAGAQLAGAAAGLNGAGPGAWGPLGSRGGGGMPGGMVIQSATINVAVGAAGNPRATADAVIEAIRERTYQITGAMSLGPPRWAGG